MFEFQVRWTGWWDHRAALLLAVDEGYITPQNALGLTIAKWEEMERFCEEHPDDLIDNGGRTTCALCQVYGEHKVVNVIQYCEGCPVLEYTGLALCNGTPFDDYIRALGREDVDAMHLAIQAETRFLRSLLPR